MWFSLLVRDLCRDLLVPAAAAREYLRQERISAIHPVEEAAAAQAYPRLRMRAVFFSENSRASSCSSIRRIFFHRIFSLLLHALLFSFGRIRPAARTSWPLVSCESTALPSSFCDSISSPLTFVASISSPRRALPYSCALLFCARPFVPPSEFLLD